MKDSHEREQRRKQNQNGEEERNFRNFYSFSLNSTELVCHQRPDLIYQNSLNQQQGEDLNGGDLSTPVFLSVNSCRSFLDIRSHDTKHEALPVLHKHRWWFAVGGFPMFWKLFYFEKLPKCFKGNFLQMIRKVEDTNSFIPSSSQRKNTLYKRLHFSGLRPT